MRASKPFTDWARCTLHAQLLLSIAFSSSFASDQTMFAAGPDVGVIRSVDGGRTWTASPIGPDEGPRFSIAVAPNGWVFSDSQTGVWRSRDNGATWEPVGEPVPAATVIAGPQRTDGSWLLLVVSMSGDLLMSSDRGASWHVVSGHFGAGVVAATVAADGTLFVTTRKDEDLALWRSVDDGATWQRYLVERSRAMCALAVSPEYAVDQRVYVGLGSRILTPIPHTREVRSREQRPLWRGVDLGAEVSALATPPGSSHGHLVYAATNSGLFVSRDGGEHFGGPRIDADAPSAITGMALSPNYTQDRLAYGLQVGGMVWRRAC